MTKSKSEITAEKILTAAFNCIAAKGCNSVTLREIAQEAGVVLSQLNYYFVNKEGLFSAVIKAMRQTYTDGLDLRMKKCVSFAERITALASYNEELLKENTALYQCFLEFFNYAMWSEPFKEEMAGFVSDILIAIDAQVVRNDEGNAPQPSPFSLEVITRLILAASFGLSIQYLLAPADTRILPGFDAMKAIIARAERNNP
ncbi:TetR/AcrR family transcriptional regulator [Sodalis sp. dw_96]|uniref:TetR/AcrR family transcriptional regulator n=1 Tax=Sodalis sp. dw_96 TaxID=2719794 RepID=UPI001BD51803|nr:TetR/AcrR family transcriptional regulator [Sodalis sp. dw_96]